MTRFLESLAKALYRTPAEAHIASAPNVIRVKDALFYAALTVLAIGLVPFVARQTFQKKFDHVEVDVPLSKWHVVYGASRPCAFDARSDSKCFANPANPALWKSAHTRDNPVHDAETLKRRYQEFWVGVTIPAEQLRAAAARTANHFIIGWIRGTYRIWLDGDFIIGGKWADNEPLALPITMGRLQSGRPLHVAIEIINDAEVLGSPDTFARGVGTGFANKETVAGWRRAQGIAFSSRPLALFVSNLLLAIIFFLIWTVSREKHEHFYIALYALANALVQLKLVDSFYLSLTRSALNTYGLVVVCYYSAFSMFVGFAFARMRPAIFKWGIPLTLLLPVGLAVLVRDPLRQQHIFSVFYQELGCFFAVIGALACLLQARLLHTQRKSGIGLPVREARLLVFGLVLLLIAVNCGFDYGLATNHFFHRTGNVFLLLVLGMIALRDYQEERLLIQKAPVSAYHRRAIIPNSVQGAMLVVDLKNSEQLFRIGAAIGRGAELVDICISHLTAIASEHRGVVILNEGDMIRVFFDSLEHEVPALVALNTCDAAKGRLRGLEAQLQLQFSIAQPVKLEFRAAIAVGSIRPVWHEIGTLRYAGWAEAGRDNTFVESTRLMDLDNQLPTRSSTVESRLVLTESLAVLLCEQRPELATRFTARNLVLKGKHGRDYCAAFYLPAARGPREVKRAA